MKIRERRCDACDATIKSQWFSFKTKGWGRGQEDPEGFPEWPRRIELCEECWHLLPNFVLSRKEGDW